MRFYSSSRWDWNVTEDGGDPIKPKRYVSGSDALVTYLGVLFIYMAGSCTSPEVLVACELCASVLRCLPQVDWGKVTSGVLVDSRRGSSRQDTMLCKAALASTSYLIRSTSNFLEAHSPQLKPLFRSSLRVNSRILVYINTGTRSILASEHVADKMAALIKTHLHFGVQLEHFNPLRNALMHAKKMVSKDAWTPEIADAWRRLFAHCSAILMVLQKKAIAKKAFTDHIAVQSPKAQA